MISYGIKDEFIEKDPYKVFVYFKMQEHSLNQDSGSEFDFLCFRNKHPHISLAQK